jgi:hypothetical protein
MGSSKLIKGKLSSSTKVHATPLTPETKSPSSLLNISLISDKKIYDLELTSDSYNSELPTSANESEKKFQINTGLLDTEPAILLTSEFKPLYGQGKKSAQGQSIQIKEDAKIITAKTALELISQSEEIKNIASKNKQEIINYADSENKFLVQLMLNLNKTISSLDISTYAIPSFNPTKNIGSLYEILKKNGYSSDSIVKFCQTKLWQQSLIEVKKSLLSHSPELTSQNSIRRNSLEDHDPFILSDVETNSGDQKRIWMNSYSSDDFSVPDQKTLIISDKIEDNVTRIKRFSERQYVNLSLSNVSSPFSLASYVESSRDISIISNIFFKEYQYSKSLNDLSLKSVLQDKFGYSISTETNNYKIWDHLVGRFSAQSIQSIANATGNGNSLASYSRKNIVSGQDSYNVLTFEKSIIPNSNSTPGSYYYVDSSLNTVDGENFDTTRLDSLVSMTQSAHSTVETIFQILGYDFQQTSDASGRNKESYSRTAGNLTFESIMRRTDFVTEFYKKILKINGPENPEFFGYITGIHYDKIKNGQFVNPTDSNSIRLAALICKAAVYPSPEYSSIASTLKSYLFLWIINVLDAQLTVPDKTYWQGDMQMASYSNVNELTINEIKLRISSLIASVKTKEQNDSVFVAASNESRTYIFTVSEKPGIINQADQTVDQGIYLNTIQDKIFNINGMSGLWGIIVQILKEIHQDSSIYRGEKTLYSGFEKTAYLFCCFDMILRIIASQTPESLAGTYSQKIEYTYTGPNYEDQLWISPTNDVSPQSSIKSGEKRPPPVPAGPRKISLYETGILVAPLDMNSLNEDYFNGKFLYREIDVTKSSKKLASSIQNYNDEQDVVAKQLFVFRKYLFDLGTSLASFKSFLTKNFKDQLQKLKNLYALDGDLLENQKSSLLNLSFSDEQTRLTRYILSEIKDRASLTTDSNAKIKSLPQLSTLPSGSIDFFPVNDIELVSYSILSKYFQSNEFLSQKGYNKKIISVGIPPKLNRKLRTTSFSSGDLTSDFKRGIVRLRIFKVDRLHPAVVFLPKIFLFDMNRFPTRVLNNWNYETFLTEDFNLLSVPNKIVVGNGLVLTCRDYNSSFPKDYYGNFLSESQKLEIYANHSISFLCEEYLRWFTECRFDETRYNNFSKLKSTLSNMENQFLNYSKNVKRSTTSSSSSGALNSTVEAIFTDPTSGTKFKVPVYKSRDENSQSKKNFSIPFDETLKSYFLNETFFSDPTLYKKKISYPKKFDRVFSVIIDPDDFYVDESVTPKETLDNLKEIGVLAGGDDGTSRSSKPYKNKDSGPNDVSLDEYFVTVEPSDYEMEFD